MIDNDDFDKMLDNHFSDDANIKRSVKNLGSKHSNFSNVMKEVASLRDEKYLDALHKGIAQRDNTYQAIDNARLEKRSKISKSLTGKTKSQQHKESLKAVTTNKPGDADWEKACAEGREKRDKPFWAGEYSEKIGKPFVSRNAAARYAKEQGLTNSFRKMENWTKDRPTEYFFIQKET